MTARRDVGDRPKYNLGLDFDENLEGFIHVLNWLSVVSYTPAIMVVSGVMTGVMLRVVRLKSTGRIFVMLLAPNWTLLRWLEHRFLTPANKPAHRRLPDLN